MTQGYLRSSQNIVQAGGNSGGALGRFASMMMGVNNAKANYMMRTKIAEHKAGLDRETYTHRTNENIRANMAKEAAGAWADQHKAEQGLANLTTEYDTIHETVKDADGNDVKDDQGNVTYKRPTMVQHYKDAGVKHSQYGTEFGPVSEINAAREITKREELARDADKSGDGGKPTGGGGKGGNTRQKGGTIAATVRGIKSGEIDFEQATGGEFGDEMGISPKLTADFGAHAAAGGTQESYLAQFGNSGRRLSRKNDLNDGINEGNK